MRGYRVGHVEPGELITPDEFNAELSELVGGMHRVDRDNIAASLIGEAKIALGAWGGILIDPIDDINQVTHQSGQNQQVVYPMPDEDDVPWIKPYAVGDGELAVSLGCAWADSTDNEELQLWIGIRVDGVLVAQSPMAQSNANRDHGFAFANIPVRAGIVVIEAVYGIHAASLSSVRVVDFMDRVLTARQVLR